MHATKSEQKKQHAERNLIALKNKIIEEEWNTAVNEWRTTLSRISECFDILFPRLSIPGSGGEKGDDGNIADSAATTGVNNSVADEHVEVAEDIGVGQFFRRQIGVALGRPYEWDYDVFVFEDNVKNTLDRVAALVDRS